MVIDKYTDKKRRAAEREAELVRVGQDIGSVPGVVDAERKERCRRDFREFCATYLGEAFYLPWSNDHLKVISKIQKAVENSELFAVAMPRGSGKTLLCQAAVLWAALYGKSSFICLIAANAGRARSLLETIKVWVETNDALLEDFPEVCYPVRSLERIVNRQKGQKSNGVPTRIEWVADRIVLPTIQGAETSGIVVSCSGLSGGDVRGQQFARPDGSVVRPSLVLVDDPQTTDSAWSVSQSHRRESILAGDVLGMAGPGKKIAGLLACTVIRPGDMADAILDRKEHPEWQGERIKLVYEFPKNKALWDEYAEIRSNSLLSGLGNAAATDFYSEHRAEMDEGAIVSWEDRYNEDELSAIQHAMNLRLRDEEAFFAEYQNEPIREDESPRLGIEDIAGRVSRLPRGIAPLETQYCVGFIDCHENLLYFAVVAFGEGFRGSVVDYGSFPDQRVSYYTLRGASRTIPQEFPGAGVESATEQALNALTNALFKEGRYTRESVGDTIPLARVLVDANWGQTTDVVYSFVRRSQYRDRIYPYHGRFIGASGRPIGDWKKSPGEIVGLHWRIPAFSARRGARYVLSDVNYWKSFLYSRLSVPVGDPGSLSLFGDRPTAHRMIAEHLTAEVPVASEVLGRRVDEWRILPGSPDNHFFDCLTGCCVAGSILGLSLNSIVNSGTANTISRERVDFSELYETAGQQEVQSGIY